MGKPGYDYLATAAHFAAESSTGTNVNVCTTDDFTKSVDALVYYIDPEAEEMKIAYPNLLFDRNITDGRAMMCSVLTLTIGNNQGMGDVEYGKIYDIYFPPKYLRLFDGPACNIVDMWRNLGRDLTNGGLVVGTIIKPKLGLQPKPFGEACYAFWQGGDFIKNDEPLGATLVRTPAALPSRPGIQPSSRAHAKAPSEGGRFTVPAVFSCSRQRGSNMIRPECDDFHPIK